MRSGARERPVLPRCWKSIDEMPQFLMRLGGAVFGERTFSTVRDASKIALVHLASRLIAGGFTLLDTQFVTDHLRQFGTVEVDRDDFQRLLEAALRVKGNFLQMPKAATPAEILTVLEARSRGA